MNEFFPIVTVVALCYNHQEFVVESLQSVLNQSYSNIELIVIDDFSVDGSREKILKFVGNNPSVRLIFNPENLGNCRSFNQALKIARGKYIIDLSTDDVMLPNRISEQVKIFENSANIGVVFSDCEYINAKSKKLSNSTYNHQRKQVLEFPIGNVYAKLLAKKLYINPPTMMVRKELFDKLGGYDESLTYEDFDFWLRSARISEFGYVHKILVQQRKIEGSHSSKFIQKRNVLIPSKLRVCQKALLLNETEAENLALIIQLKSLLRQSFFTEHFEVGLEVIEMLRKLDCQSWEIKIFQILIKHKLPMNYWYLKYNALRRYINFRF